MLRPMTNESHGGNLGLVRKVVGLRAETNSSLTQSQLYLYDARATAPTAPVCSLPNPTTREAINVPRGS
jgi:hypothetical protein